MSTEEGGELAVWYNSFYFDVTDAVNAKDNVLAVRLENEPESSRWYPGAGLYRNVHLVVSGKSGYVHGARLSLRRQCVRILRK